MAYQEPSVKGKKEEEGIPIQAKLLLLVIALAVVMILLKAFGIL
jgi:hypothetical protein